MISAKFAGNKKVDVEINGFTVHTDLSKAMGGDNTAPNPFEYLMAALVSCSALNLLAFITKEGMNPDAFSVELQPVLDADNNIQKAVFKVTVPADLPKEKEPVLKGFILACKVGKHLKAEKEIQIIRK